MTVRARPIKRTEAESRDEAELVSEMANGSPPLPPFPDDCDAAAGAELPEFGEGVGSEVCVEKGPVGAGAVMRPVPEEAGGGGGDCVGALLVSTRRLEVVAPAGDDESTIVLEPTSGGLEEPAVMTTTLHRAWMPFPA